MMAGLIARLPWDGRVRHVRDGEYFRWRFRNPLHEYRFLYSDEGNQQGYLVLQRYLATHDDRDWVNIVDWEASDHPTRAVLLATALRLGRFSVVRAWTAGLGASARAILRNQAFRSYPPKRPGVPSGGLLVRALGESQAKDRWELAGKNLLDFRSWDLRMVYSMEG